VRKASAQINEITQITEITRADEFIGQALFKKAH
jgi:hypothetical protein